MPTRVTVVEGDPLAMPADVLVSPWTTNWIPWWMLHHGGLQGEIRLRGGDAPYRELARAGRIRHGEAFHTSAARLPFRGIIHVALTNLLLSSSEAVVSRCVNSAVSLARQHGYSTVCSPVLGGVAGVARERALELMLRVLKDTEPGLEFTIVTYPPDYLRHLRRHYRKAWTGS